MAPVLEVRDLRAEIDGRRLSDALSLTLEAGATACVAEPWSKVLLAHPSARVVSGSIRFKGEDITALPTHQRARRGIFLAFRDPPAIPGVTVAAFLRAAMVARGGGDVRAVKDFRRLLREKLLLLGLEEGFGARLLDGGFSPDENARFEALQSSVLKPALAIVDGPETAVLRAS